VSFSFFLKTISNRTLATESINNENLKGRLLNNGDAYLIKDGHEYFNLMPVWDWELLPGVTNFMGKSEISRQHFTGSVSDKDFGLSAMDYRLEEREKNKSLSTHKIWVCHDDLVVCLISDIQTENIQGEVFTALDQSRWQGDVTVNKVGNVFKEGTNKLKSVKWIHHGGFGYIPIKSTDIDLHLNTVTSTWQSINKSQSALPVTEKVFKPVMVHHLSNSVSEPTGYVLVSCNTPQQVKNLSDKPTWKILSNDRICQAVSFSDKTLSIAFFSAGSLKVEKSELTTDKPCLILITKDKIFVSDPNHNGGMIKISWNDKVFDIEVSNDGTTTKGVPFLKAY
jgi:chondroitin AC lyase